MDTATVLCSTMAFIKTLLYITVLPAVMLLSWCIKNGSHFGVMCVGVGKVGKYYSINTVGRVLNAIF